MGIVIGIVSSFILIILAFRFLIQLFDISTNVLEYLAILVICIFGLSMIFPSIGNLFGRIFQPAADLGAKIQKSQSGSSDGLLSGLILGVAIGLLWTPCAGPILATIITLAATSQVTTSVLLLALSYGIGAAIPMLLIMYGGRYIITSSKFLTRNSELIHKFFGVLLLLSAFILATHRDTYFTQLATKYFPFVLLDDNPLVKKQLENLRANNKSAATTVKGEKAPEFVGITNWINSKPLTLQDLKGKVVLVDFWTYSCINCIRTLPYLTSLYDKYHDKGLIIVGVHTPEFAFEKDSDNVLKATQRFGIHYPVAQDNDFKTWQAYENQYWPAHYLIDQSGVIRQVHFGEGAYMETENAVRLLLNEKPLIMSAEEKAKEEKPRLPTTPETYLGYKRSERYSSQTHLHMDEIFDYTLKEPISTSHVGLKGKWLVGPESITAESNESVIELNFIAAEVYLVLSGKSSEPIRVLLDGKPVPKEFYSKDMNSKGEILFDNDREYTIVSLKDNYGKHTVTINIPQDISAYAFTFGD